MDRRHFLRAMIAAGVGATLDPEQLLWTPRTMITVPAMSSPHAVYGVRITKIEEYEYAWFHEMYYNKPRYMGVITDISEPKPGTIGAIRRNPDNYLRGDSL